MMIPRLELMGGSGCDLAGEESDKSFKSGKRDLLGRLHKCALLGSKSELKF